MIGFLTHIIIHSRGPKLCQSIISYIRTLMHVLYLSYSFHMHTRIHCICVCARAYYPWTNNGLASQRNLPEVLQCRINYLLKVNPKQ